MLAFMANELQKTNQQQLYLYRWLEGPNPELVNEEIEDLKEKRYL
jgi:hypothetical protein